MKQTKNSIRNNRMSMLCPKCGKRVFDLQNPKGAFEIQLKCPNCHRIVTIEVYDLKYIM